MKDEEQYKKQILQLKREKRYLEDQISLITSSNVFSFGLLLKSSISKPWLLPLLPFRAILFFANLVRQYFQVFVLSPFRTRWFKSHPPEKVAFLCYSGQTGGGERVALAHLKRASKSYKVDAYFLTKPGPISDEAKKYADKVIFGRRPEYDLAGYKAVYITLCMPDISIIKKINPGIKIIFVLHDHLSGWIDYFQGYSHTPLVDKFVGISKLVINELLSALPDLDPKKTDVLYNPYFFGNDNLNNVVAKDGDEFVFGYVGRISPEKNPVSLVRVFKKFIAKHPNVKLKFVGGIDESLANLRKYRELLVSEIGDNNNIEYLGYSNNTKEFIRNLDGMVFSSFIEGISVAATEALSFGVPVLTSNVGAMGEIIQEGVNGYSYEIDQLDINPFDINEDFRFFSDEDEKRCLEKLEKFVEIKWNRKSIAQEAMNQFSEEVAYENFIQILDSVLND